jgi:hypothetical protein
MRCDSKIRISIKKEKKNLNINLYQMNRNANQNYNESPSCPSQNCNYQENKQQQMLERMQGKRDPHTLLVGMQISPATIEISMEFHQKATSRSTS